MLFPIPTVHAQEDGDEVKAAKVTNRVVDGGTKVYADHLYLRVHAADCPELLLKERKRSMTLAEADKAGADLHDCLLGYERAHPLKPVPDGIIVAGDPNNRRRQWHVPGCHRYFAKTTDSRMAAKDVRAAGYTFNCKYCSVVAIQAAVSEQEWAKIGPGDSFVAPEGWVPKPYSPSQRPPKEQLDMLIQETLGKHNGIQELTFTDSVATLEHFYRQRFFFPVHQWLDFYMAYRATGDRRLLDKMLESARHYHTLSVEYPAVVQEKASTPEGLPYMFSMAACARITLQLARKQPAAVGAKDVDEAEAFLRTMVSVLKPTCEGSDSLDPDMGLPKRLADDFRFRAFNRSMNGIGTISLLSAALQDLRALKGSEEFRATIDRYRKVVREYLKYWFSRGHFCAKVHGEPRFYYPYAPREGAPRAEEGCVIFSRPEDIGHYSHTLQGLIRIYEATPDLGCDDSVLTAVANAVHHNATTKVTVKGKALFSGYVECPTMSRIQPEGGGHLKDGGPAKDRFYVLQAFREDMIDSLCGQLSEEKRSAINSSYDHRIATLYAQYVRALRRDRSLIHLGELK